MISESFFSKRGTIASPRFSPKISFERGTDLNERNEDRVFGMRESKEEKARIEREEDGGGGGSGVMVVW
ncbi:hypothetical protein LguiB_001380 [Lonicera macranthoides]